MHNRTPHFINRLGDRPLLLLALILIFGGRLILCLVRFVGQTNGIKYPDLDGSEAAGMMAGCIAVVLLALSWRLMTVNRAIRRHVAHQFREALRQNDADFQDKLRQFVRALRIRGNFLTRMLQLIRLTPKPFCALVLVLAAGICLCLLTSRIFGGYPERTLFNYIFANSPWSIATAIFAYLLYNDIWVIDTLETHVAQSLSQNGLDNREHLRRFAERLSGVELLVFQKRFLEHQLVKNVASDLHFSDRTAKTHLRNIREKWLVYCRAYHLHLPLETSVARAKMEE